MDILKNIETAKDLNSLDLIRKQINEACDKRAEYIKLCNRANELSESSFGYIKEAFESLSPSLFNKNDGRNLLKRYTDMVKGSKNLSSMHSLYENVRTAHKDSDVDFFVNSVAEANWNVDKKKLSEDTKKVGKLLAEAYFILGKECEKDLPKENITLSSALEYIAENRKSLKNLSEYSNAVKIIRENVEQNVVGKNKFRESNLDSVVSNLVREFNEKYSGNLNENEEKIIKELAENSNHEEIFNKYKENCSAKLSEAKTKFEKEGDTKSVEKLQSIQEQISNKKYAEETIGSDICNLMEISKIFE